MEGTPTTFRAGPGVQIIADHSGSELPVGMRTPTALVWFTLSDAKKLRKALKAAIREVEDGS